MNVTCPECRATLEPDEIDRTRRECPLCSASLADLDLSAIEDQLGDDDEEIAGNPLPLTGDEAASASETRQVEIIERTGDRLVAHLPPSTAGSGGIGGFTLIWNGFMTLFTVFGTVVFMKQGGRIELVPILFLSLFWAVGVGLFISWTRMRFTRMYLLLEKDRLVIQRKLLGTSNRELPLTPESKATLEESYAVNEVPVYSVTVQGQGRKESFGTGLSSEDKEYLAREINTFLGVETANLIPSKSDVVCSFCGVVLGAPPRSKKGAPLLCDECRSKSALSPAGTLWQPLRGNNVDDLPESLVVDDSDPAHVLIQYPLFPRSSLARRVRVFLLVVATVWMGLVFLFAFRGFPQQQGGGEAVFSIVFAIASLIPAVAIIGLSQVVAMGKITISIAADWVRMSWGWGPFSIRKQFLPETITECRILRNDPLVSDSDSSRRAVSSRVSLAGVKAGGQVYPLVTFHGIDYGQKVIRLVRTYLLEITGRQIPD